MIDLFFPRLCQTCGQRLFSQEACICIRCTHLLPLACHHRDNDTELQDRFYGSLRLSGATSLLQFQKSGATQKLLHKLKYRSQQQIGDYLGKWLGTELRQTSFAQTDVVIPVPLHKRKLRKRGYNQVAAFGQALAITLGAKYRDDVLIRTRHARSSVFKGRFARSSTSNPFKIKLVEAIGGMSVLLVDDIVTTGMTMEHCGSSIWEANPSALRLATMFIA